MNGASTFNASLASFSRRTPRPWNCYDVDALAARLRRVEPMWRGFAFEGASTALMLPDCVLPGTRRRFDAFVLHPPGIVQQGDRVGADIVESTIRNHVHHVVEKLNCPPATS
jgi:hypothetical protein